MYSNVAITGGNTVDGSKMAFYVKIDDTYYSLASYALLDLKQPRLIKSTTRPASWSSLPVASTPSVGGSANKTAIYKHALNFNTDGTIDVVMNDIVTIVNAGSWAGNKIVEIGILGTYSVTGSWAIGQWFYDFSLQADILTIALDRSVESIYNRAISGNTIKDGLGTELRVVVDSNGLLKVVKNDLSYLTDSVKVQGNYSLASIEQFGFQSQVGVTNVWGTDISGGGHNAAYVNSMIHGYNGSTRKMLKLDTADNLKVSIRSSGGIEPTIESLNSTYQRSSFALQTKSALYALKSGSTDLDLLSLDINRNLKTILSSGGLDMTISGSTNIDIAASVNAIVNASVLYASDETTNKPLQVDASKNLKINESGTVSPSEYIKTDLVNGASNAMNVDGSTTSVTFTYTVPASKSVSLFRSTMIIEDSNTAFTPSNFGQLAALTNGVLFKINGITIATIKTNRDLAKLFYDLDTEWKTAGAYKGRWTHNKDVGKPIKLTTTQTIQIFIQDDLTGLDAFEWMISLKVYTA